MPRHRQALRWTRLRWPQLRCLLLSPMVPADSGCAVWQWRKALREHLQGLQQQDGSFVNAKNPRWMESMQVLCTCYAMLALERCR